MQFQHSGDIWRDFPALVPGVLYADGITSQADVEARADRFAAPYSPSLHRPCSSLPTSPASRSERQPSYASVVSGSDPPRVSRACSASCVGFGWPARPR